MDKRDKKMIAPIVITVLLVCYFMIYILICILIPIPLIVKILAAVIPLALAGVAIFCLVERINEIRSGEEDDLSKY